MSISLRLLLGRTLAVIAVFRTVLPSVLAADANCASFGDGTEWGAVSISNLKEASGIAASRRNPGVLWTHNDGSGQNIYAIGTNGARLATFDFKKNVADTEDIAVGPGPTNGVSYLYLGDIGGSQSADNVRNEVKIIRMPEPEVDLTWAVKPHASDFAGVETFKLKYPDGSYDAESLMVDPLSGDLFVITKQEGEARIYRAQLNGATNAMTLPLQFECSLEFSVASAADISADGTQIAVRREDFAMLWTRQAGESITTALSRPGIEIPVIGPPTEPNGEGLGFLSDGSGYVTISEGTDPTLYFFPSLCPRSPQFTMALTNTSVLVGGSAIFQVVTTGNPAPLYSWTHNGATLSGQTNTSLSLSNLTVEDAGTYQIVAANEIGATTNSANLEVRTKPDLRITEVMAAEAKSASITTADWWELTSFESQPTTLTRWRFNDTENWNDAFVFTNTLAIAPGESVVFVEGLTEAQFRTWWGASNLPKAVQIISYAGNGLSAGGDSIWLWNDSAASNAPIVSITFKASTPGVSLNYNPVSQTFGELSQLGANGVIQAASSPDIGSPGRILAPVVSPQLQGQLTNGWLRLEFEAAVGRKYSLESRDELAVAEWNPTGDFLYATNNTRLFFEKEIGSGDRFYRVRAE